jgi:hypothetical protein
LRAPGRGVLPGTTGTGMGGLQQPAVQAAALLCPASRPRAFVRSAGSGGGALLLPLLVEEDGGARLPRAPFFLQSCVAETGWEWEVKKRRPRRRGGRGKDGKW